MFCSIWSSCFYWSCSCACFLTRCFRSSTNRLHSRRPLSCHWIGKWHGPISSPTWSDYFVVHRALISSSCHCHRRCCWSVWNFYRPKVSYFYSLFDHLGQCHHHYHLALCLDGHVSVWQSLLLALASWPPPFPFHNVAHNNPTTTTSLLAASATAMAISNVVDVDYYYWAIMSMSLLSTTLQGRRRRRLPNRRSRWMLCLAISRGVIFVMASVDVGVS